MLTAWKNDPDTAWLYEVSNVALQQGLQNLQHACVNFWAKSASGRAWCRPVPGTVQRAGYGSGMGTSVMVLPFDQVLREQRFTQAHPEWLIQAQDGATRFVAEKGDGRDCHVVAALSLRELLDRRDEIVAGR